jgi:hypothetical protein
MDWLEKLGRGYTLKPPGITQAAEVKRPVADLFIGGLLLVLALGGFAM